MDKTIDRQNFQAGIFVLFVAVIVCWDPVSAHFNKDGIDKSASSGYPFEKMRQERKRKEILREITNYGYIPAVHDIFFTDKKPRVVSRKQAQKEINSNRIIPWYAIKIDINSAGQKELESLRGIGPVKARAIMDYRTKHGNFKQAKDLVKVNGIGPKTIERIINKITVKEISNEKIYNLGD